MLCYRDRWFCSSDCTNTACDRNLTEDVLKAADEWWGKPGAPISTMDGSIGCEDYKPPKEKSDDTQ